MLPERFVHRGAWHVHLGEDHRGLPGPGVEVDEGVGVVPAAGRRGAGRGAGRAKKHDPAAADVDFVTVLQGLAAGQRAAVERGAVAALQVLHVRAAIDDGHGRVLAADGRLLDHDVAAGMPADDDPVGADLEPLAATVAVHFQKCHRAPRA